MSNDTHTLEQLQAHAARPAAEARVNVRSFMDVMKLKQPAPTPQPPAEGGAGVNAAKAWQDAISGRAPQFIGLSNTQDAARQWMGQAFQSEEERARKDALKATVSAVQIERAAVLATGVMRGEEGTKP